MGSNFRQTQPGAVDDPAWGGRGTKSASGKTKGSLGMGNAPKEKVAGNSCGVVGEGGRQFAGYGERYSRGSQKTE